jgi:ATP adenylyltransferase
VSLDRLWAGWRNDFVTAAAGSGQAATEVGGAASEDEAIRCVFCRILASGEADSDLHILWRDPTGRVIAILNAYPYTSGHLMVMPIRHVGNLEDLDAGESQAIWAGIAAAVRAIKTAYRPDGLNIGANLGRAAGAGVPGHFHLHALPRWSGDTNFMTTVADARVLPESLTSTDVRLRAAWPTDS